jgi:hypothetical protein
MYNLGYKGCRFLEGEYFVDEKYKVPIEPMETLKSDKDSISY